MLEGDRSMDDAIEQAALHPKIGAPTTAITPRRETCIETHKVNTAHLIHIYRFGWLSRLLWARSGVIHDTGRERRVQGNRPTSL